MKTTRIIAAAILLTVGTKVSAQYDNEGYYQPQYDNYNQTQYSYQETSYYDSGLDEGWCNFYGEYSPMNLVSTAKGVDDKRFDAATIGFSYNYPFGNGIVSLEAGFEASGAWFSRRYDGGDKYSVSYYFSKIPVNIAFGLRVADGFTIVPYGGVHVKWNISAEERFRENGKEYTFKLFDDEYMDDDDYHRFQFGYQAGVKFIIGNSFSIGATWKADLTPFCKFYDDDTRQVEKEKFQGIAFNIGYCF